MLIGITIGLAVLLVIKIYESNHWRKAYLEQVRYNRELRQMYGSYSPSVSASISASASPSAEDEDE